MLDFQIQLGIRDYVFKWHKGFSDGRLSYEDDTREGRQSLRASKDVRDGVRDVINPERRLTVRDVAEKCGMSKTKSYDSKRTIDESGLCSMGTEKAYNGKYGG